MTVADVLVDAFGRVREEVHGAVEGLSADALTYRVDPAANTVAWLVWHLTRIEDDHVADLAGTEQVWTAQGWHERSGLPFDPADTGYGHSSDDVAAVRLDAEQLLGYADAVHDAVVAYVRTLTDDDLPRVVDERWDPPVTLAVRLVSVIGDGMQHAGQAAFVRGVAERRRR
jgi:uncharacterized damage-inducible protein DinB